MTETRNLGLVKAIFVGTTPPTNTQVLWYDTSLAAPIHKYFDTLTEMWVPLQATSTETDSYRLGMFNVNNSTDVVFSSELPSSNYYVKVLEYIATDGTNVRSGWDIPDANKQTTGFRFAPPSRYLTGVLWYEAKMIK
jgi:hypothetical protein